MKMRNLKESTSINTLFTLAQHSLDIAEATKRSVVIFIEKGKSMSWRGRNISLEIMEEQIWIKNCNLFSCFCRKLRRSRKPLKKMDEFMGMSPSLSFFRQDLHLTDWSPLHEYICLPVAA
jgi:hypothetical protein